MTKSKPGKQRAPNKGHLATSLERDTMRDQFSPTILYISIPNLLWPNFSGEVRLSLPQQRGRSNLSVKILKYREIL